MNGAATGQSHLVHKKTVIAGLDPAIHAVDVPPAMTRDRGQSSVPKLEAFRLPDIADGRIKFTHDASCSKARLTAPRSTAPRRWRTR